MATIPYREALLMKRMAWRNLQPRKPSEADARYVPTAVQMLTCIACLDYAMCDMEQELTDAGMMRHAVKRAFVRSFDEVIDVHSRAKDARPDQYRCRATVQRPTGGGVAGHRRVHPGRAATSCIQHCIRLMPDHREIESQAIRKI